jgi:hypothetical protein
MSKEELTNRIIDLNNQGLIAVCDTVMGVSCGDGGVPRYPIENISWEELTVLEKWRAAGGRCPGEDPSNNFIYVFDWKGKCSTGCVNPYNDGCGGDAPLRIY